VLLAGEREPTEIGAIEIVKFINPAGLHAMGKNLFLQTAASGDPISGTPGTEGLGTIAQGFLERSNVNIVEEMVNMIIAQRAYEANSRSVITSDFMLGVATALRR
jgi:flagellar basal-body rod protein FlgG